MATTKTTTGQFTITDHNDAQSITSYIRAELGQTQIYAPDAGESDIQYIPDWRPKAEVSESSGPQILTVYVYPGSGTNVAGTGNFTDVKWYFRKPIASNDETSVWLIDNDAEHNWYGERDQSVSPYVIHDAFEIPISEGKKLTHILHIKKNILSEDRNLVETFFCTGNYKDSITGLKTFVVTQVTISATLRGANATYCTIIGPTTIYKGTTSTPSSTIIKGQLYSEGGEDNNVLYKWSKYNKTNFEEIFTDPHKYIFYKLKDDGELEQINHTSPGFFAGQYIQISEEAVDELDRFQVEIRKIDSSSTAEDPTVDPTYNYSVAVTDLSDPYACDIISDSGNIFKNNQGGALLTPSLKKGSSTIEIQPTEYDADKWIFSWTLWDQNGNQIAFVDKAGITKEAKPYKMKIVEYQEDNTKILIRNTSGLTKEYLNNHIKEGEILKLVSSENDILFIQIGNKTEISTEAGNESYLIEPTDLPLIKTFNTNFIKKEGADPEYYPLKDGDLMFGKTISIFNDTSSVDGVVEVKSAATFTYSGSNTVTKGSLVKLKTNKNGYKVYLIDSNEAGLCTIVTDLSSVNLSDDDMKSHISTSLATDISGTSYYSFNKLNLCEFEGISKKWKYGSIASVISKGKESLLVTSDDIDVKGTINLEAFRPAVQDMV